MVKLVSKKTTTTVTEEIQMVPAVPGEEKGHRFLRVSGYGTYQFTVTGTVNRTSSRSR